MSGIRWSSGFGLASLAIQLPYTVVASRILAPSAFGIVALSGVLLRFVSYFSQFGISPAIVQKETLDRNDVRTAFTISVLLGAIVFGIGWGLAPLGATLLGNSEITGITRWMAASFLISGFTVPALALIQRARWLRLAAMIDFISFLVAYPLVGLGAALLGAGVWSLVAATLVQGFVAGSIAFAVVRPPLTPCCEITRLKWFARFGGLLSLTGFLEFLGGTADTIAVGHYAGVGAAGQYNRATALTVPMARISTGAMQGLLPSFSRIQSDRVRSGSAYLAGLSILSVIVLPASAVLAAVSLPAVTVLLGTQWRLAGELLPLMSFALAFSTLTAYAGIVMESVGRLASKVWVQVLHLGTVLSAIAFVVEYLHGDARGFVAGWLLAEIVRFVAYGLLIHRVLGYSLARWFRVLAEALGIAATAAVAATSCGRLAAEVPLLRLAMGCIAGAITIVAMTLLIPGLTARQEFRSRAVLRPLRRRGSKSSAPSRPSRSDG